MTSAIGIKPAKIQRSTDRYNFEKMASTRFLLITFCNSPKNFRIAKMYLQCSDELLNLIITRQIFIPIALRQRFIDLAINEGLEYDDEHFDLNSFYGGLILLGFRKNTNTIDKYKDLIPPRQHKLLKNLRRETNLDRLVKLNEDQSQNFTMICMFVEEHLVLDDLCGRCPASTNIHLSLFKGDYFHAQTT